MDGGQEEKTLMIIRLLKIILRMTFLPFSQVGKEKFLMIMYFSCMKHQTESTHSSINCYDCMLILYSTTIYIHL